MDSIYIVLINGKPYRKDSAIRTYKTRERAEKESQRYVKHGYTVLVGEFALVNTTEVKAVSE
ncbi:hypothetical protein V7114_06875 [Neobacillus niacini]|uniref:hypothetical protein n=1 Tax=Neobacillus niacini TaxID=86668 RepID=UPI002FFE713D